MVRYKASDFRMSTLSSKLSDTTQATRRFIGFMAHLMKGWHLIKSEVLVDVTLSAVNSARHLNTIQASRTRSWGALTHKGHQMPV